MVNEKEIRNALLVLQKALDDKRNPKTRPKKFDHQQAVKSNINYLISKCKII